MNQERNMKADRMAGAEAISAKAIAIGMSNGVTISQCVWDIGEDLSHQHAHRLDLFAETKSVRLYFPDLELTSNDEARSRRTEDRLRSAIAQLVPRSPAPTYATSV